MNPKHILFLIGSLGSGGAERQTIDLINRLNPLFFRISLAYFVRNETLKPLVIHDKIAGIYCLDKKFRFDFHSLRRLNEIIEKTNPDLVICVNPYPLVYTFILHIVKRSCYKIIVIMHSTIMPNKYKDLLTKLFYRYIINKANKVIFVCKNQMEYWHEKYKINPKDSYYIYNGVDTKKFSTQMCMNERKIFRKRIGINDNDYVVCICATLSSAKRHVDLIDAIALLRKDGTYIKILIVGDGPERQNIEKYINERSMDDSVIFTGFQTDIRPFVEICDIFSIVSSSVETFSIAILEAMAMSKPIIASDIGGAREQVLNDKNGYLFQAKDVNDLANKIRKVLEKNENNRMGIMSRELVVCNFSVEKMVSIYEEFFLTLLIKKEK